jgi:hypothetical protein
MTVINFQEYLERKTASAPKDNVTQRILEAFTDSYMYNLVANEVNIENEDIAFDIATIQFLMRGMAHRSQGETHPSQILLDKLKHSVVGGA